ncbi:MAG: hypothetical protein EXS05_18835 [Planctomycetaceae bacterium]|nr:hypothetical protein [Planctomycetaceae bacterium]
MSKKKTDDGTEPDALTITEPSADGLSRNVQRVIAPGALFGPLCHSQGTALPSGTQFDGLYFKVARAGEIFTKPQVVAQPDATLSKRDLYGDGPANVSVPWIMDRRLLAASNAGGTAANTLYVVSKSLNVIAGPPFPPPTTDVSTMAQVGFKGKSVDVCSGAGPGPGPGPMFSPGTFAGAALFSLGSSSSDGIHIGPHNSDGEWLLYSGLSAANHFFGNRLFRNGIPLRARVIAVAAADIDWSFDLEPFLGVGRRFVRRATGDLSFDPVAAGTGPHPPVSSRRFPNDPTNAIVVWQNKLGLPDNVVSSQCRQQADLIHLDPTEDILVQVNYNALCQSSITGTFSLWVKIIDQATG